MKNIIPLLNKYQLLHQDQHSTLPEIAHSRQALLVAIKEAVMAAIKVGGTKQNSAIEKFVVDFDECILGIKK